MNRSDFVAIIHKPFSFSSDWIFTRKISFHFAFVFFFIPKCLHLFAEPQHLKSSLRFYLDTASMQLSCNAITIKRTLSTTHNYVRTVFYVQIWSWTVQKWHTSEASLSSRVSMQCGFFVHKVAHAAANGTNWVGSLHCHKHAHTCTRSVFLWTNLDFHLQSKPLALWDNKKNCYKKNDNSSLHEKKQWVYSRILLDRITHVHIIQWAQIHAC